MSTRSTDSRPRPAALPWAAALLLALPMAMPAVLWPSDAAAQFSQLTPPERRITDAQIQADHRAYESLQGRLKLLNDRGRPVRDYHLAKAQCWLDVSFHEYTRNDRSAFPQEAMTQSEMLIVAMERDVRPLPLDTPLVNNAARLRPDLWARLAGLRAHRGFPCAQAKAACAEVELVHAGNEHNQQQWRHAKPYVQIAEDLLYEGEALAEACLPPAPPPPAAPPPPPPAPPAVAPTPPVPPPVPAVQPVQPVQTVQYVVQVLFNFDRHDLNNIRPFSLVQLEEAVRRIQAEGLQVRSIKLSGHADRLKHAGQGDYNQRLSEKRVATVRAELLRLGIAPGVISTGASGDSQQVTGCEQRFTRPAELQECLLPNRRVEVVVEARRRSGG